MSNPQNFCWWYPTSDVCQEAADGSVVGFTDGAIMEAKLSYTFAAAFQASLAFLLTFRYRSEDWSAGNGSFYDDWSAANLGTEFWKYASYLQQYSSLAFYGTALLTSLLDIFGVATSLNWMVWSQLGMVAMAINVIYLILMTYAFDIADKECRDAAGVSCNVRADMKNEIALFFGTQAFSHAIMVKNMDPFLYANKDFIEASDDNAGLFSLIQF